MAARPTHGRIFLPFVAIDPSPTATPTPILRDDFSAHQNGWVEQDLDLDTRGYANGGYQIRVKRGPYYATSLIDVRVSNWTAVFTMRLQGSNATRRAGFAFGSAGSTCNPSVADCYRLYLSSNGEMLLVYQAPDGSSPIVRSGSAPAIQSGQTYSMRVDRRGTELAAWVSSDGERSWSEAIRTSLDAGRAGGTYVGFVVSAAEDTSGDAEAIFDDLRVWSAGQIAPP